MQIAVNRRGEDTMRTMYINVVGYIRQCESGFLFRLGRAMRDLITLLYWDLDSNSCR